MGSRRNVGPVVSSAILFYGRSAHVPKGKFWHRHRRPRPVEYNTNPEAHMPGSKVEPTKTPSRRKGRTNAATPVSEAQTPRNKHDDDFEMAPSRLDNALSPVSTASSVSEAPLSRAKTNGSGHHPPQPPKSPTPETKGPSSPTASGANSNDPPLSPSAQRAWVRCFFLCLYDPF